MKPILFPEGQDENGADVVVYLPEKVLHSTSAANYPYQRTKVVDFSSDFQSAPTAEELRAKGEKYIENNDMGDTVYFRGICKSEVDKEDCG